MIPSLEMGFYVMSDHSNDQLKNDTEMDYSIYESMNRATLFFTLVISTLSSIHNFDVSFKPESKLSRRMSLFRFNIFITSTFQVLAHYTTLEWKLIGIWISCAASILILCEYTISHRIYICKDINRLFSVGMAYSALTQLLLILFAETQF